MDDFCFLGHLRNAMEQPLSSPERHFNFSTP
jgi:hypothetical protein